MTYGFQEVALRQVVEISMLARTIIFQFGFNSVHRMPPAFHYFPWCHNQVL